MNAHFPPPLLERKHQSVDQDRNGKNNDWNHDDVIENLNQTKEDVEEGDGSAHNVGVVQFYTFVGVVSVLNSGSKVFQPFCCIGGGTCRELPSVNRHAEVHVVVVHEGGSLGFFQHLPSGENWIRSEGRVSKIPRLVDTENSEVGSRHWHAAVDHFILFWRDFTVAVFVGHGRFEQGRFVDHISKGERVKHIANIGFGF